MKTYAYIFHGMLLICFCLLLLSGILVLKHSLNPVKAVSSDIVISEIQIAGLTANDEFVELYNPTQNPVDVTGWRLSKRASTLTGSISNLVSSLSGTIPSHGYFLIANPQFTGTLAPDLFYSATTSGIAANNTVILYRDNGQTIVDKVGMGSAQDVETSSSQLPEANQSIERKAHQSSTAESMNTGEHAYEGNGFDSDNNSVDFIVRINPQPQSTQSSIEPSITTSPTTQPQPTSIPTITPTKIPIPTETPISTPSPFPTGIPTSLPTPIPTAVPTPLPTSPITPTSFPSPETTVHVSQTPTPTGIPTLHPTTQPTVKPTPIIPLNSYTYSIQCKWKQITMKTMWFTYKFQIPQCSIIKTEEK